MNRFIIWFLVLPVLLATGCQPPLGQVAGVVTYNGKPLPGGTITFRPADPTQNTVAFVLARDGKFNISLPVGEIGVCVDNREFEPAPPTTAPTFEGIKLPPTVVKDVQTAAAQANRENAQKAERYVKIPERYYAVETSGLTITVKKGFQQTNIELKDE